MAQNQYTNLNDKNQNNNFVCENNIKDINNPFIQSETSINDLNKISHKRQRTHFNLGKINEDIISNKDSLGSNHNISNEQSSSSANTVIENIEKDFSLNKNMKDINYNNINSHYPGSKSENIFCEALKEMSNYNKTLKKMNNNSKKNILDKNENNINNENIKINKVGNKLIYNIPYNINRIEYNNSSDNGNVDIRKNIKNELKNNMNNNNDANERENENLVKKKQQSIYYRSVREKEKKKIEFTKRK